MRPRDYATETPVVPKCGTYNVELFDGRFISLDVGSAQRLEKFIDTVPYDLIPEANRMCLCITGSRNGVLDMPNERWRGRFSKSLDGPLRGCDIQLAVGSSAASLYEKEYVEDKQPKGTRRRHG